MSGRAVGRITRCVGGFTTLDSSARVDWVPLRSRSCLYILPPCVYPTPSRVGTACSIGVGHAGPIITLRARNGAAASEPPSATVLWPTPRRRLLLSGFSATQRFRGNSRSEGGGGWKFAGKADNAVILEQAAKFAECSEESRLNYVFPRP